MELKDGWIVTVSVSGMRWIHRRGENWLDAGVGIGDDGIYIYVDGEEVRCGSEEQAHKRLIESGQESPWH